MDNYIIAEGFKDDVSSQVATEHKFKNIIIDYFQNNGFNLVKTPLIEKFDKKNNNVLKILVKKNEDKLSIRDDITLQVARLSQTRLSKKNKPLKLCYYGEVVRHKGTMLRPERQFLQIGAECIGEKNLLADVEILELAYTTLKLVGIKEITIEISSRVFFDNFFLNIQKSKIGDILRLIKLKDLNGLLKILDKKNHNYIKDLFSCTGIFKDKKINLLKLIVDKNTSNEVANIIDIVDLFSLKNKDANIYLDLCEVDDKNYHSGVRFTFFANNVRGEIAKGGRYFVNQSSGQEVATGFTCYMDSILRASLLKVDQKKIMVPFNTSNKVIQNLIKKQYIVIKNINGLKITKKLAYAQNCQFFLQKNSLIKV